MVRFIIKDFDLSKNSYQVLGMLPGGFAGSTYIGMTDPLNVVLTKLNNLSGAVQAQFLPMWLINQPAELPKNTNNGKEEAGAETNVPKPAGKEDSPTIKEGKD